MYRKIVEGRIRKAWRRLAQGDYEYVLDQFSPRFEYSFAGDDALGGTRHSRASMTGWFERLFELFPGIQTIRPQRSSSVCATSLRTARRVAGGAFGGQNNQGAPCGGRRPHFAEGRGY